MLRRGAVYFGLRDEDDRDRPSAGLDLLSVPAGGTRRRRQRHPAGGPRLCGEVDTTSAGSDQPSEILQQVRGMQREPVARTLAPPDPIVLAQTEPCG